MANSESKTLSEILTQFKAWETAIYDVLNQEILLRQLFRQKAFAEVIFTGCGSSYYSALTAAAIFQTLLGLRARGLPSSDIFLFPGSALTQHSPVKLVAISRSGETSETIQAVRVFKAKCNGDVLAVSCSANGTLVAEADISLVAREAKEESVVQTRSFTTMLLMLELYAGIISGQSDYIEQLKALPEQGERIAKLQHDFIKELGANEEFDRFIFLGSGPYYGLACEAMLKMKEMALSPSEAFHFLEFQHGPKVTLDEKTLVVGLLSDSAREYELQVIEEVRRIGAKTVVLAERAVKGPVDYLIQVNSGLSELVRGLLYMPLVQLLAYCRALSRGLNPGFPRYLDGVIKLKPENFGG